MLVGGTTPKGGCWPPLPAPETTPPIDPKEEKADVHKEVPKQVEGMCLNYQYFPRMNKI